VPAPRSRKSACQALLSFVPGTALQARTLCRRRRVIIPSVIAECEERGAGGSAF